MSRRAVIGLGSNLGDRLMLLAAGVRGLRAAGELRAVSSVMESPPLGPPQPDYLNAAALLTTPLPPEDLLAHLMLVERRLGRERRQRWGPRTLDLDLLWMEGEAVTGVGLTVPHPGLQDRPFALWPLLEVAPDAVDPRTGSPLREAVRPSAGAAPRRYAWPSGSPTGGVPWRLCPGPNEAWNPPFLSD